MRAGKKGRRLREMIGRRREGRARERFGQERVQRGRGLRYVVSAQHGRRDGSVSSFFSVSCSHLTPALSVARLDQIVREGVVVVDDNDRPRAARAGRLATARAGGGGGLGTGTTRRGPAAPFGLRGEEG